ncbi:hypothetical protein [uncultured Bradyrhizobium sp.]|uniref:hypothetical protein n=1 Tax=uncultured Bradyrhizobium sp. TaxID=199684 RepID=UPI0035CB1433
MFGKSILSGAIAALAIPCAAQAQLLKVVEVNAPKVNCVFQTDCKLPVTDTSSNISPPFLADPGTAWMQSRTFAGEAGAPGAGTTGYEYRLSMTQASAPGCIFGFNLNFGPHKQLPYANNELADVYVVTTGGLGTIGLKSAERNGDIIMFTFAGEVCADGPPDVKKTTFFFGLAAAAAPMKVSASVYGTGDPGFFAIEARVPTHSVPEDPPGGL